MSLVDSGFQVNKQQEIICMLNSCSHNHVCIPDDTKPPASMYHSVVTRKMVNMALVS